MRFATLQLALLTAAGLACAADTAKNRSDTTEQLGVASFYSTRMDQSLHHRKRPTLQRPFTDRRAS